MELRRLIAHVEQPERERVSLRKLSGECTAGRPCQRANRLAGTGPRLRYSRLSVIILGQHVSDDEQCLIETACTMRCAFSVADLVLRTNITSTTRLTSP